MWILEESIIIIIIIIIILQASVNFGGKDEKCEKMGRKFWFVLSVFCYKIKEVNKKRQINVRMK